jgi:hypothetical protein
MSVAENLAQVEAEIAAAAKRAGRNPDEIKLVAVSKTVSAEVIAQAIAAGADTLGENKVQEALSKQAELSGVSWHLIGHLQTNKARKVIGKFALIHSLDSMHLARELSRRSQEAGVVTETLVQVNVGCELSKYGLKAEEVLPFVKEARRLPGIKIEGLMAIPPQAEDPESSRPYFRQLRDLCRQVAAQKWPEVEMRWLSMGMSADFQVAIEEGANIVRVGTRIFGHRPRKQEE